MHLVIFIEGLEDQQKTIRFKKLAGNISLSDSIRILDEREN